MTRSDDTISDATTRRPLPRSLIVGSTIAVFVVNLLILGYAMYIHVPTPNGSKTISPTAIRPQEIARDATALEVHDLMYAHPENAKKHPPIAGKIFAKERDLARRLKSGVHDNEAEARSGEIRCPTLAVFGREDRLVSSEAARVYREKIPNCNIAIVYDAGHCIIGERPEALLNTVVDYAEHWETFIVGRQTGLINP